MARQALAWLLYCPHPLKRAHLTTGASIDLDIPYDRDAQRPDNEADIVRICRSLVSFDPDTESVELCHISVTQFLQSLTINDRTNKHCIDEEEGNTILLKACFRLLQSTRFTEPLLAPLRSDERRVSLKTKLKDRLILYAISGWTIHAKALPEENIAEFLLDFIKSNTLYAWSELWEIEELRKYAWWKEKQEEVDQHEWPNDILCEISSSSPLRATPGTPLYYMVYLGFPGVVSSLLETEDPNLQGGPLRNPLRAALDTKRFDLAKLLLQRGSNRKHDAPRIN
jgi:hypothetical protein